MAVSHVEPQNLSLSCIDDKIVPPIVNIATKPIVAGY